MLYIYISVRTIRSSGLTSSNMTFCWNQKVISATSTSIRYALFRPTGIQTRQRTIGTTGAVWGKFVYIRCAIMSVLFI